MRLGKAIIAAVLLPTTIAGCSWIPGITDTSCKSFKPIRGSIQDTTLTKRQVVAHNKVFDTICPAPG